MNDGMLEAQAIFWRDAKLVDAEKIAALHTLNWLAHYQSVLPKAFLDNLPSERLVFWQKRLQGKERSWTRMALKADGSLLGFICVTPDAEPQYGALIENLHIAPASQGLGFGRMLLLQAFEWIKDHTDAEYAHLWAYESNRSACAFYLHQAGELAATETVTTVAGNLAVACRFRWRVRP